MSAVNRRRFLDNCAWLVIGGAGGMLLPRLFSLGEPALARDDASLSLEERLRELKIELPIVDKPVGYVSAVRVDNLLYVSGYEPRNAESKPDRHEPASGVTSLDGDAGRQSQLAAPPLGLGHGRLDVSALDNARDHMSQRMQAFAIVAGRAEPLRRRRTVRHGSRGERWQSR